MDNQIVPRRREYPREKWLELKPVIERLYVEENLTFKNTAKYLGDNYNFEPTKRQFLRKISEWGLEKNVKRAERRSILLDAAAESTSFEGTMLRGRKLNKAKIHRWSKRDGLVLGQPQPRPSALGFYEASMGPLAKYIAGVQCSPIGQIECDQDSTILAARKHCQHAATETKEGNFNLWDSVNVIDSPRLTGLFGALTIFECEEMMLLDAAPTSSALADDKVSDPLDFLVTSNNFEARERAETAIAPWVIADGRYHHRDLNGPLHAYEFLEHRRIISKLSIATLLYETSPFPQSSQMGVKSNTSGKLKVPPCLTEHECTVKYRTLSQMEPVQILNLVDSMWDVARNFGIRGDHGSAEAWYRRIVTAKQKIPRYRPQETLRAHMQVAFAISYQGRYSEALHVHQDIHTLIQRLVPPDNHLALYSRRMLAWHLDHFGKHKEEEGILREILQISLGAFGPTEPTTLDIFNALAWCLIRRKRYLESIHLLRIVLNLERHILGYPKEYDIARSNIYLLMNRLARALNRNREFGESEDVLNCVKKSLGEMISIENFVSSDYYFARAELLRSQGQMHASEQILRNLLKHQGTRMTPNNWTATIYELARILVHTSREREAITLYEKSLARNIEIFGLEHRFTMSNCKSLGFCYVPLGLHDEAILHFQRTIADISELKKEHGDDSNECIFSIRGWIAEIEKMKTKQNPRNAI